MTKPAAVRAITAIAWIRIAFAVLLLALVAHAAINPAAARFLAGGPRGAAGDRRHG